MKSNGNDVIRNQIDEIRKNTNVKGFERWRAIGETVITDLKKRGQFFNTEQGLFFFDSEFLRAFRLASDEVGLSALINQRYGINPKEHGFGRVVADLTSEAYQNGRQIEIRRLAHFDLKTKRLYVSRFDGLVYRLDGQSVVQVQNGTDDVFFFDERMSWEPYSYTPNTAKGEFDRQLIDSVNFADSVLPKAEQRKLLKLWVLAVFFASIQPTKIILLLLGEHGSGKTSALRRIQKFIFGSKAELLSIEKEKQDGFIATVTTDPLALFDNLDERLSWLPYALSRLATGVTFSRRQLYTTNTKAEFPGVSWLAITSRTVRFMDGQADLPDRTLVLRMERLSEKTPEQELLLSIAKHRNVMWSELLDQLNAILGHLRKATKPIQVRFRMADFASFALKVATIWGCRKEIEAVFGKLEHAQADLVFEDEPVHQVLGLWLKDPSNHGRSTDAATLHQEWSELAEIQRIRWSFPNSKSLGQRLGQLREALSKRFNLVIGTDLHDKQYCYRFWPKAVTDEAPKPKWPAKLASMAKLETPAGMAG
jgi:hypothetical protein